MDCIRLWVFACALSAVFAGHAAWADAPADTMETRLAHAVELLAARNDSDSLAAAAILDLDNGHERPLRYMTKAAAAAPDRPDLIWLESAFCQLDSRCDLEPIEKRLRSMDSRNGAAWLGSLNRAEKSQDELTKTAVLAAISRSERVDIYWTTLAARLSRATAATGVVTLTEAEIAVIGALSGQAIPAYQVLSNACKGEHLTHDDVVQTCRGISQSLFNGDTYITSMVGVAIAKRVWPENSPRWTEAVDARRSWDHQFQFLAESDVWNAAHTDEYLTLCAQYRREQDVFKAELTLMGKDAEAPAN